MATQKEKKLEHLQKWLFTLVTVTPLIIGGTLALLLDKQFSERLLYQALFGFGIIVTLGVIYIVVYVENEIAKILDKWDL
ncbi:MAG: hypothetical protein ACKVOU_12020 [Cytophagales bacterium]